MNLSAILFLAAVVVFVLALFGVQPDSVNMTLLGLALTASGLLAAAVGDRRLG